MITLSPTRLHWIKDDGVDDPSDLCAHSPVKFQIDRDILIQPSDGDFTVSAAAIYLLRTLESDHSKDSPVGDHLFPCCGHAMFDTGEHDVVICGCPNGTELFVTHCDDGRIRLTSPKGGSSIVSAHEWRRAVHDFSDAVRSFYDHSLPKTPSDDTDTDGFAKMMAEWDRRIG